MNELRKNNVTEQKNKEKLQSDLNEFKFLFYKMSNMFENTFFFRLKTEYEKASNNIDNLKKKSNVIVSGELLDDETTQKRIKILENQLVGGEQANNEALKQKRFKKIKEAEKKRKQLACKIYFINIYIFDIIDLINYI